MAKAPRKEKLAKELDIFRKYGGILRTTQALKLGIHPRAIYAMRDSGMLEQLSRGVFRLADLPPLEQPDLVTVASRIPNGVICLISALSFHDLTTQIPHEVYVALQRGSEKPRCEYPPVRLFWFSGTAFSEGVEIHKISRTPVRIYNPEKTIADCFKYRNKIGVDVAVEALKKWIARKSPSIEKLTNYARTCGVEKVLKPYLEALL
jgi:predicted transcriptional regulator of viral defense system